MPSHDVMRMIMLFGGLVGLLLILLGVAIALRSHYGRPGADGGTDGVGFSLNDLQELRDRGELSAAEYEIARNKFLSRHNALPMKSEQANASDAEMPG